MKVVLGALQGRLRRLAVLGTALLACTIAAAGAAAQLPGAPEVTSPAPVPEPIQKTLQQPLPGPAEDVVRNSPAGDVREAVRGAVGAGAQGGGTAGGGDATGRSGATAQSGPAADRSSATAEGAAPGSSKSGDGAGRQRAGSREGNAGTERSRGVTARPVATARPRPPAEADGRGPVGRTIRDIAEVVPAWAWIALGALAALALALAARAAVERRRRRRLEREREQLLGDLGLLQSALLPEVPERLGALAASVAYRPADGPAAGGDFYDAFELPDGRVAAIVGDVSGHGREALVNTVSVRHSLRTFLRSGLEPRAALAAGGRLLTDNAEDEFVTVVVAVHDPGARTLTYATAGHPPPIVTGAGAHEPVTVASSPPLGLGLPTGLRQTTIPLPRGSVACFFTDGLLEARVGGGLVGRERLAAMVAGLEPGEGAERLLARMLEETDATPDDMAACVVRALEGQDAAGARVEELEVGSAAVDLEAAGDLLRACGVAQAAVAEALDEAAAIVSASGGAILVTTLSDGESCVEVIAPDELALAAVRDR